MCSQPPFHNAVAVFGGSFNPPHMGHQMACLYLLEALGIREVWLIPAFRHAFGKVLAPFEDRLRMCELVAQPFTSSVGDQEQAKEVRVKVLDVERELDSQGRMYETVTHLRQQHPGTELRLVIGADILAETHRWHRWDDLAALAPPVVLGRQGYEHALLTATPEGGSGAAPAIPNLHLPKVASTELRHRLGSGLPVTGLMPVSVATYAREKGLYQPAS